MELLEGDLRRIMDLDIPAFRSEQSIAYYIGCIASALHHLHDHNILHRDVKPENILCDHRGRPVLTDFGVSYIEPSSTLLPLCCVTSGTLAYLAPEVLTPCHIHSYQADFWSLGILMCEMLYGVRPFALHCPRTFVYYSANTYAGMWISLKETRSEKTTINWEDAFINSDPIHPPAFPEFNATLLADGSLPDTLTVNFELDQLRDSEALPPNAAKAHSPSAHKLICGLLDVRVEKRIGSNWNDFVQCEWLKDLEVDVTDVSRLTLPLPPDKFLSYYVKANHHDPIPVKFDRAHFPELTPAQQALVDSFSLPVPAVVETERVSRIFSGRS
jgi:serine/threonine protein kinase